MTTSVYNKQVHSRGRHSAGERMMSMWGILYLCVSGSEYSIIFSRARDVAARLYIYLYGL